MKAYEAVKRAAELAGVSLAKASRSLDKPDNYISNGAARGSTPKADTLAAMLGACGYVLAAVPAEDVPASALVVDPAAEKERA